MHHVSILLYVRLTLLYIFTVHPDRIEGLKIGYL
jgi:hypothetical protein